MRVRIHFSWSGVFNMAASDHCVLFNAITV